MRALLILAVALINAPVDEQYEMVADLCDVDPHLAVEVLDVADELGADTDELALMIMIAVADLNGDRTNERGAEELKGDTHYYEPKGPKGDTHYYRLTP